MSKRKGDKIASGRSPKRSRITEVQGLSHREFKYEQERIYFRGRNNARSSRRCFTNSKGFYMPVQGEHLIFRYEVLKVLGCGSFGIVVKAEDHKRHCKVAIKILRKEDPSSEKHLEEIKIYEYISACLGSEQTELSCLREYFIYHDHICIVLGLCGNDLYIGGQKKNHRYTEEQVKCIIRCIAKGLKRLHMVNLVHCDIKQTNIAFQRNGQNNVKIIDLGNSRHGNQQCSLHGTLPYTAPEIFLHLPYGPGVDIWSMACTAYELATGEKLFPGRLPYDYLISMMEVLGVPPPEMIKASHNAYNFFYDTGRPKYCTSDKDETTPLLESEMKRMLPGTKDKFADLRIRQPEFVQFLEECLAWNPKDRLTANQVLLHRWVMEKTIKVKKINKRCKRKVTFIKRSKSYPTLRKEPGNLFSNDCCKYKQIVCGARLPYRTMSNLNTQRKKSYYHRWLMVQAKYLNYKF